MTPSAARPLRLLLASVLKPVDDTRMFEKFGRTLAEAGYAVHIAGRASRAAAAEPGISLHPIFGGHRLSFARLLAQWRYWQLLRGPATRPDLVIVHAPELLPLTLLWHWLRPAQRPFFYDVRENYALNIDTQQVYQGGLKHLLSRAVRWVETRAARRAAAVLLAERSYADELPFLPAGRTVLLENKYAPPPGLTQAAAATPTPPLPAPPQVLRLLFSGTISALNGVFESIEFANALRAHWPGVQLTIIGYCQRPDELARLQTLAHTHTAWLRLVGADRPVPHVEIVREIGRSHLGLLPYRPHPSSWRCVPTKLYEYLANGLPVLVPPNPLWTAEVARYAAGQAVPFDAPLEAAAQTLALAGQRFYPNGAPADALWQTEAPRLLQAVAAAR